MVAPRTAEYDWRDPRAAKQMMDDHKPEIVIHCAARVGGIKDCRDHPAGFFYDNLMIGTNTLHASCEADVQKFVGVGTVCSYPEWAPLPMREDDLWNGYPEKVNAPYGLAKKMMLVQGNAYRQQFGFSAIHLLLANLYGPGDNFHPEKSHVIPGLIRKFIEAKEANAPSVTLWGDGTPTREFLHADDAARGILLAAEKYDAPDPVNLGSGQEIAVKDLAQIIAQETGYTGEIKWDTSVPNGQPKRCLDTSRAQERFGFTAEIPLNKGIAQATEWFMANRAAL